MTQLTSGPTILVVDDDPDVRSTLAEILAEEGYRVMEAASGREALAYLQTSAPPALILLDLMMPDMDGWQFREEQQADPRLAAIPVVVVSAFIDDAEKVASLGAIQCLRKPVALDVLLETIERGSHRVEG